MQIANKINWKDLIIGRRSPIQNLIPKPLREWSTRIGHWELPPFLLP